MFSIAGMGRTLAHGICIIAAGVAFAQEPPNASCPAAFDARTSIQPKPTAEPPSIRFGLGNQPTAPGALFELSAPDTDALLAEDAADRVGLATTSLRVGIARPVSVALGDMSQGWTDIVGVGRLWRAAFRSGSAQAIRLRFVELNLPPGAELWTLAADSPDMRDGPVMARGPFGDGQTWTTILAGDTAIVEYFEPAGAAPGAFVVDDLMHIYRNLMNPEPDLFPTREGPCHTDVSCEPAWHPLHNAIARCTFINGTQQDLCTGALLATTAGDLTPYYLTAQHCCQSQAAAQTAVFFWQFQTSTCNGTVPPLNGVPTSMVADLLASRNINVGSDFAFLMIRGALPPGLAWAGWDTANVPVNTQITCIHHPTGAYKRIMHGTRVAHPSAPTFFWGAVWGNGGVVEFCTSGAPMFRDDTQALVGQASHALGSPITCSNPTNTTGYGRFNQAFGVISSLLTAGADDSHDAGAGNDACSAASSVAAPLTQSDLVVKSVDEDWYAIQIAGCQRVTIAVTYTQSFGDVDLELYETCGGPVFAASTGTSGAESLEYANAGSSTRTVYARVFLANSTRNTYNLSLASAAVPNCTPCPADLNGDGNVGLTDLAILLANFGRTAGATPAEGDLTGDGAVNLTDLAMLLTQFGNPCP